MNRAVFLDRDGVITQEPPYYAHKLSELALLPKSADAIRLLNENGFLVVVACNQAGIAHGYYREEDAIAFNQAMKDNLAREGARIDAMYYCPHHPEARIERYRVKCNCRKPEPGMLTRAGKELNLDLRQSFMVGDKLSDIEAGKRAGCKTIMVRTGQGVEELKAKEIECDYVADNLCDAVEHVIGMAGKT
ncbi:MAG TPA: D-glycero-beta-D-manno-heptose 1,7-bisphosphate 7-phosphatase [Dehalococcoidia bacterium]|nr:D-glycero-beta-D-manno-heptose 1,7-bisphosphate 7-phosphatase [Dehalococcoidia bacterium]